MNTRNGDSAAKLIDVIEATRRYFKKRRMAVRIRAIEADALPIVTIAYRRCLDRLGQTDYLGKTGDSDQFVIRLKGLSIHWDRPRGIA